MKTLLRSRLAVVWFLLVAATVLSWWLGADHGVSGGTALTIATAAVLVIAFVKVRFIGLWFMELRNAPRGLRLAFECWVWLVGSALVVLYVAG